MSKAQDVFPASAGMNRSMASPVGRISCVPRIRGDEPLYFSFSFSAYDLGIYSSIAFNTAQRYVDDGSIEDAVPLVRALLEIMHHGESREGWTLTSPEFRALFERENILASDWYAARIEAKIERDRKQAEASIAALTRFATTVGNDEVSGRLNISARLTAARDSLDEVNSPAYREHLVGSLGLQPVLATGYPIDGH